MAGNRGARIGVVPPSTPDHTTVLRVLCRYHILRHGFAGYQYLAINPKHRFVRNHEKYWVRVLWSVHCSGTVQTIPYDTDTHITDDTGRICLILVPRCTGNLRHGKPIRKSIAPNKPRTTTLFIPHSYDTVPLRIIDSWVKAVL